MTETDKNYYTTLRGLKEKIVRARQKAAVAVNQELLLLYWEIGNTILEQQAQQGWGAKVIDRLAVDLKMEFPDMKGLSVRNLKYMRKFAEAWPIFVQGSLAQMRNIDNQSNTIVQGPLAQLQSNDNQPDIILQGQLAKISWYHHITLLDKLHDAGTRLFYVGKAVQNGWSRNVMLAQIESCLHLRQGQAITNFDATLSPQQSDLVKETLKSPYLFDFLGMGEAVQERELEKALIQHIRRFMLELGRGFAYVGNQYNLLVQDDEYFLDLLFYNYHLHCFVVFELKVGDFKPEYTGKLNFYINTVNEQMKGPEHKPTIGVLLCKTPNQTVVKYSLQGMTNPMGIAEYEFTRALPQQLTSEMPTIEELEQEMEKEIEVLRNPLDEKKNQLKALLARIKGEELRQRKNDESVVYIFCEVLEKIRIQFQELLGDEMKLFKRISVFYIIGDEQLQLSETGPVVLSGIRAKIPDVHKIGIGIYLTAFKKGGIRTFDVNSKLWVYLDEHKYIIADGARLIWSEYLYHHQWSDAEIRSTAEKWCELIIDEMYRKIEELQ